MTTPMPPIIGLRAPPNIFEPPEPLRTSSNLGTMCPVTRVLVVEDDPDIAQLVAHYLGKSGFSVDLLTNGRDALASIAARAPDVLVLDLMLPQVDGLEICRVVRGNEATAGIPIIMLTARAEESDRIVGLEIGADDYLAKPFSPNELVARVRALVRRAQRTHSA